MNVPNITLNEEFVLSQIKDVRYFYDDSLTICVITTLSGFKVTGESHCFNMERYDRVVGMESARAKATDKLFSHIAYYLKTISNN